MDVPRKGKQKRPPEKLRRVEKDNGRGEGGKMEREEENTQK